MRINIWKMVLGRLLTNVEHCHRDMSKSNEHICPRCNLVPETLMHVNC
jgi:hypothetical protein